MDNPLLNTDSLPSFGAIRPEHIEPAIRQQLSANRARLAGLLESGATTFSALVEPIEAMQHQLQRTWSPASHLNGVVNSPALREAYNICLALISEYQTELGQNDALFQAYAAIREHAVSSLDPTQCKLLDNALRDFRLAGVALDPDRKTRFRTLMQELAREQARFEENVLDSANAWSKHVTDTEVLRGLPTNVLDRAREMARAKELPGWLLTLDQPTYLAVLTHAEDDALRCELYTAWSTRASDQANAQWDNSPIIENILQRRHEAATLLGFPHYAAFSLATKMARSAEEVRAFLEKLADYCVPVARAELAELERFAGRALDAWDVPFYAERLQRELHDISDEELRPYFPLARVLDGLFDVAGRLYGLKIRESSAPVWDPEVRFFEIRNEDGEAIGSFYVDPYARANKRSGAWMDECLGRLEFMGRRVLPVAYLVCNFLPPVAGRPALLTHDEVVTLFHEFGHGLHHLLTRVRYPSLAGINGVPWDAVELPSQFMENYAWNADVLRLISGHIDTGAQLPESMIHRLQATRTFHAGLKAVRQLEFALCDLRLHSEYQPQLGSRLGPVIEEVRKRVAVVPAPPFNRFAHSFGHVFAGGYAAGYYSYKWAEVLAADAFAAFEEAGVFDTGVARRFLDSILSRGGSRDALEAFVEFRGRAPDIRPLLRQFGIAA
jgi:oligopeptidase A